MSKPLLALLLLFGAAAAFLFLYEPGASESSAGSGAEETAAVERAAAPVVATTGATDLDAAPELAGGAESVERRAVAALPASASRALMGDTIAVTARLLDENDRPIAGGTVGVFGWTPNEDVVDYLSVFNVLDGEEVEGLPVFSAATGADGVGRVAIPDRKENQWVVFARAEGRESAGDQLPLRDGASEHDAGDFQLGPASSIALHVVDAAGKGLGRASVSMFGEIMKSRAIPFRVGTTDDEGKKRYDNLPAGTYQVTIVRPGYVEQTLAEIQIAPQAPAQRQIMLDRGESLHGRVVDHHGDPLEGVSIYLRPEHPSGFLGFSEDPLLDDPWAVTGRDGRFTATGVDYEKAYVVKAKLGEVAEVESAPVQAGAEVLLEMPRTVGAFGAIVLADGRPAAGARLHISEFSKRWWNTSGREFETNEKGVFEATLQSGKYRLTVIHDEAEESFDEPLEVGEDPGLGEWRMPAAGAIELSIVCAETGKPVESPLLAELDYDPTKIEQVEGAVPETLGALLESDEGARMRHYMLRSLREDPRLETGKAVWAALRPGWYRFRVTAPAFAPQELVVELGAGAVHSEVVRLVPGCDLTVTLVNSMGGPAEETEFVLLPAPDPDARVPRRDYENMMSAFTDKEGRYTFHDLAPGMYALHEEDGWGGNAAFAEVEVVPGANEITATLPERIAIVVRVHDGEGPVEGATVTATPVSQGGAALEAGYVRSLQHAMENGQTDADGLAVIEGLSPGPHRIMVQPVGGWRTTVEMLAASDGQEVDVLLAGFVLTGRVDPPQRGLKVSLTRQSAGGAQRLGAARFDETEMLYPLPGGASTTVRTRRNGEFKFRYLDEGSYAVEASGSGFLMLAPELVVVTGNTRDVVLPVIRESRLTLRVTGMGGRSQSRYTMVIRDPQGKTIKSQTFRRDGDVKVRSLVAGSYTVQVRTRDTTRRVLSEFAVTIDPDHDTVLDWDAASAR